LLLYTSENTPTKMMNGIPLQLQSGNSDRVAVAKYNKSSNRGS